MLKRYLVRLIQSRIGLCKTQVVCSGWRLSRMDKSQLFWSVGEISFFGKPSEKILILRTQGTKRFGYLTRAIVTFDSFCF